MSTPEFDSQQELLRSIATSLKAIHTSLENLTGAVEGVAESIEKAHEPEGDLGVHLVSALKDLSSSLHKRAQQERSPQPSPQHRRENRPQQERLPQKAHHFSGPPEREELKSEFPAYSEESTPTDFAAHPSPSAQNFQKVVTSPTSQNPGPRPKQRPRGNRRGGGQGKLPAAESPTTPAFIPPSVG